MSAPANPRTSSQDSDTLRKRVCKACDRCRLKKSKCDGSSPCSRCKVDNAICVFGERKKSQDKVYPKGYVEMLEQQQAQLVAATNEMYRRLLSLGHWPGKPLAETNGHPLTHDILARLELLESKQDGSGEIELFEEDCDRLQQRLVSQGAPYMPRRGSISSDSDHSHREGHRRSKSRGTPVPSHNAPTFRPNFAFNNHSPIQTPANSSPAPQAAHLYRDMKPSPLHNDAPITDNQAQMSDDMLLPSWTPDFNDLPGSNFARSQLTLQRSAMTEGYQHAMNWDNQHNFDPPMDFNNNSMSTNSWQTPTPGLGNLQDWEPSLMDFDFNSFVQTSVS